MQRVTFHTTDQVPADEVVRLVPDGDRLFVLRAQGVAQQIVDMHTSVALTRHLAETHVFVGNVEAAPSSR